jgi:hypothetical protein
MSGLWTLTSDAHLKVRFFARSSHASACFYIILPAPILSQCVPWCVSISPCGQRVACATQTGVFQVRAMGSSGAACPHASAPEAGAGMRICGRHCFRGRQPAGVRNGMRRRLRARLLRSSRARARWSCCTSWWWLAVWEPRPCRSLARGWPLPRTTAASPSGALNYAAAAVAAVYRVGHQQVTHRRRGSGRGRRKKVAHSLHLKWDFSASFLPSFLPFFLSPGLGGQGGSAPRAAGRQLW